MEAAKASDTLVTDQHGAISRNAVTFRKNGAISMPDIKLHFLTL
jgi:hypothetical protein